MLNINNYNPSIFRSAEEGVDIFGAHLRSLYGMTIVGVWTMWEVSTNEWWQGAPVIVQFESIKLELCANKLGDFAVSFNSIDLDAKPIILLPEGEIVFEWRRNPFSPLKKLQGEPLKQLSIVAYNLHTTVVMDHSQPERVGKEYDHGWLLHGFEFEFSSGYFYVYNALDQNGIEYNKAKGKHLRKIKL